MHHILNGVIELDCLAGRRPNDNLYTAAQTQDEVQRRLRLDVIVYQDSRILNPASTPHNLQRSNCALSVHLAPTAKPTLWQTTKCSGARQQPDTKPIPPASTPELDYEEAYAMKSLLANPCADAHRQSTTVSSNCTL